MKLARLSGLVLACGALAWAAGLPAPAEPLILAGSDRAVWLVRRDDAKGSFDLALREADGDWRWVHQGISGHPAAAVADPARLHVLFASPAEHLIFDQETGERAVAVDPAGPLWPRKAAPIALCEAAATGPAEARGILAVVPRPAGPAASAPSASAPSALSATAPGAVAAMRHLGIFARPGVKWTHLADRENVALTLGSRVFVAAVGRSVYLLVSDGKPGTGRLERWDGAAWSRVPLTGGPPQAMAIGMLSVRGRLVVLLAAPAKEADRRAVTVAALDEQAGRFTFQRMTRLGKPATWPADRLPQAARLGEQVALIWRWGDAIRSATCLPHVAALTVQGDVRVFETPPADGKGEALVETFMWIVLLAVFVPMLLFRPRGRQEPFALPEGVRTGNLLKRLLAAIVDLVPVYLLVSVAYMLSPGAMSEQEIRRLFDRMVQQEEMDLPVEFAVAYIAMLVLYVVYCTVMEARTGTTLGKKLMKLCVVGSAGQRPDLRQCFLRNLLKVLEIVSLRSPLFFLVPLIPIFTRYHQRFGDLLARTTVVDVRSLGAVPPAPPDAPPQGPPSEGDQHTDHRA